MQTTRRAVLAGVGAAMATAAWAEPIPNGELREDVAVLRRAFTLLHPGLRRYNGEATLAARFAALDAAASRDLMLGEFLVAVTRLTSAIRCGHTFPNPANQGRRVREALFDTAPRVSTPFRWIDGRMIATLDRGHRGVLAPGVEIVSVDGVSSAALRTALLEMSRTDGGNDAKRLANLEVTGRERLAAFDLYRPLLFKPAADGPILEVAGPNGLQTVRLSRATDVAAADGDDAPPWTVTELPGGAALLTMPTWALYNSEWDWRAFIDTTVDALIDRRAPGLIVDVRENEGGQDCGDVLLERILGAEFTPPYYARRVRYRRTPDDLAPMLDTWDPSFKDWGDMAGEPDADGFRRLRRGPEDDPGSSIRPRGRRYQGRVVVLTSPTNSSATFQFAEWVKASGAATLVGRTTGGNLQGINGGAYFFLRLPRSGLEVDLPLIGYFPAGPRPDRGVTPDVSVDWSREDVAAGRDPDVEAAVRVIAA